MSRYLLPFQQGQMWLWCCEWVDKWAWARWFLNMKMCVCFCVCVCLRQDCSGAPRLKLIQTALCHLLRSPWWYRTPLNCSSPGRWSTARRRRRQWGTLPSWDLPVHHQSWDFYGTPAPGSRPAPPYRTASPRRPTWKTQKSETCPKNKEPHPQYSRSGLHLKLPPVEGMVTGGNGPGHTDAEEHVDGVTARDVAHTGVRILVLDGGHLTGERICK